MRRPMGCSRAPEVGRLSLVLLLPRGDFSLRTEPSPNPISPQRVVFKLWPWLAGPIEFESTPIALSLAKAAPLKPEIKLAQALSEFEAILTDDQKSKLRTYRGQPPSPTDVTRLTAEIDRDASRNRNYRECRNMTDEPIAGGSAVFHGCGFDSRKFAITGCRCDLRYCEDIPTSNCDPSITINMFRCWFVNRWLASAISYYDHLSTLFMN